MRARALAVCGLALAMGVGRALGAAFPLHAAPSGRYLVDQNGTPFFMVGDAAQSADCALTYAEFQSYVDTRVSQGFNTINVNFIDHRYCENPPADRSGNLPFTTQLGGGSYTSITQDPDFSKPNDAYFAGLEQKIAYAQSKGVLVSLAFYMGPASQDCTHTSEGWYGELCQNSSANATSFGTYLANGHGTFGGFKKYANIIWVWGADLKFTTDTSTRDKLHAVAAAMKAAGSTQLMSGDWNVGLATDQSGFQTYMGLESVYQYEPGTGSGVDPACRDGFSYDPSSAGGDGRPLSALPVFMKETGYEGELNPAGDPASIRMYQWRSMLAGCTAGYWYGHRDVWNFARPGAGYTPCLFPGCTDWTTSITSTGALDMSRFATLWKGLAWWNLTPSGGGAPFIGRVLVPGNDTSTGGAVSAAQARDGSLLLAYVPSTGTGPQSFTVDPRSMAGTARARWWDPTSGAFSDAGSLPNTATQALTTPGTNRAGSNDWVLVLDVGGTTSTALAVSPSTAQTQPRGSIQFSASGGSGSGYVWSLQQNRSGASITQDGLYTAGAVGGVTDVVQVMDALGNVATGSVSVAAASGAITYVQGAAAVPQSPTSAVTVRYGQAQSAGDLNVVVVGWNDTTAKVTSVTDAVGNVYSLAVGPTVQSGIGTQAIYYAKNIASAGAGANAVTVVFSTPAPYPDIRIIEYRGIDATAPLDGAAGAGGNGSTSNSGVVTTTNANDLLVGANYIATGTGGPGPGFTSRMITSPDGDIVEDAVVSTAGAYAASAPLTSPGAWVMQVVAFRAAGSQAPAPSPPTAPSGLTASAASSTQINLAWTNTSTTQTGVKVERSRDGVNFTQIAVVGGSATTYSDPNLTASTLYYYRVRATNSAGDSAYSNVASATTKAPPVAVPVHYVQGAAAVPQSPMSAVNVTYGQAQSAGDLNVVVVGWNDTTTTVTSVTDAVGNVYSLAVGPTVQPGIGTQAIYYAKNIVAAGAGANAVRVAFSAPAPYPDIRIVEYAGIDRTAPLDGAAGTGGNSSTCSSGVVTTTNANDLLVGANYIATATAGPGPGFTSRMITSPDGDIVEDAGVSTAGAYAATAPLTSPGAWVMQVVAFKAGQ